MVNTDETLLDHKRPRPQSYQLFNLFNLSLDPCSQEGEEIDNITVCEYSKKRVQRYRVQTKSGCVYNRGSVLNYTFRVSQDTGNLVSVLVVCTAGVGECFSCL